MLYGRASTRLSSSSIEAKSEEPGEWRGTVMGKRIVSVASLLMAAPLIGWVGVATPAAANVSACDGQWSVVPTADHSQQSGEIDSLNAVTAVSSSDQWAVGSWLHYPDAYVFHTLV